MRRVLRDARVARLDRFLCRTRPPPSKPIRDYGNPVMLLFRIRFILRETTGHPLLYPVNRR